LARRQSAAELAYARTDRGVFRVIIAVVSLHLHDLDLSVEQTEVEP